MFHPLEPRRLLAFSAHINFQPAASPTPAGYLPDTGQVYAPRASGLTYGWNADNTANTRDRSSPASPDKRYDTLASFQQNGNFAWEIAVPNGTYRLHLVSGDPAFPSSTVTLKAENTTVVANKKTDGLHLWVDATAVVTVTDGRLTLSADPSNGAFNTKINFIDITDNLADPPPAPVTFPTLSRDVTIGGNLDGLADYASVSPFIDLATMFRPWGTTSTPWNPSTGVGVTADNYPIFSGGAITFATGYPSGTYQVSYKGNGKVSFASYDTDSKGKTDLPFTITSQTPQQTTGTITLDIPSVVEQRFFAMFIDNNGTNVDPVHDLHIISPDANYAVSDTFRPVFLQKLAVFDGPLRFMDWMQTNNNKLVDWKDRTSLTRFSYVSYDTTVTVPYEKIIQLSNAVHKDVWINIPAKATDDFVTQLATLFANTLDPSLKIHVEYSNEIWNASSQQGSYLLGLARADTDLTRTDDYGKMAQEMGKQTVRISNLFKTVFERIRPGSFASQIRVELGGFIANDYWAQTALDFVKARYGDPKNFISGLAVGAYVGVEGDMASINTDTLTLDQLFTWMHGWIDGQLDTWFKTEKKIADQYELQLNTYEAGQHLQAIANTVNEPVKRAAQTDPRMADVYTHLISKWIADGGGIFNNFALSTKWSPYGYWGLYQTIMDAPTVKSQAIAQLASTTLNFVSSAESVVTAAPTTPPVMPPPKEKKRPEKYSPPVLIRPAQKKPTFAVKKLRH